MKIYYCDDHAYFYPVGVCSIVVAHNDEQARALLEVALDGRMLDNKNFTLKEIDMIVPKALIILDGNY